MLLIFDYFILLKQSPVLVLSLTTALVVVLFNYKRLAIKTGKVLGLLLTLIVNAVSALGMVVAMLLSAIGSGYTVRVVYFASFLSDFFNLHVLPWGYLFIVKYQVYLIPKFIFMLKKPFTEGSKVELCRIRYDILQDSVAISVFAMPSPVLLQ